MKKKKVYLSLSADNIHHGHINVISKASSMGIYNRFVDRRSNFVKKRLPLLTFEQRKKIITNIKGVKKVIPQNEWDDTVNIKRLDQIL